ncbi:MULTISPECIES: RDD family protein [unclassified Allomuricauda]|uniref:RDD family protein n=2 Tax=Allomuricauda TaxID=111500 RepID=UPI00273E0700|nr:MULTISPECIES: RDD family protein [unclassified Allomuricauda]
MNDIIRRAVAFYVDALIFSIPAYFVYSTIFFKTANNPQSRFDDSKVLLVQIISYIIYFTVCEFFFKSTLGKSLFRFKIKGENNEINLLQVLVRSLARIIPVNQISFLFNDKKIFWHEKWSNLYTVKRSKP